MQMIQNVVMEVAPAVMPQMSKGGPAAPAAADGTGSFAQVLQGSQANRTDTAAAADPQDAGATTRGAWLRLVNAYGTPVSATGDTKGTQAGSATPAADANQAEATAAPVLSGDLAQALETALAQQAGAGANGSAILAAAGNPQHGGTTAPQQTEKTDNQQAAVLTDAAQQPSAGSVCTTTKQHPEQQPVVGSENATTDVKDLTAETQVQQQAALMLAAAAQAANVVVQQPRELEAQVQQAEPEAAPKGVEPGAAVAVQQDGMHAAAALQQAAKADATAPVLVAASQKQASPTSGQGIPAAQPVPEPSANAASSSAGAATAAQQGEVKVVKQGPGSQSQALDALRAAGPAVHPEVSQKADTEGTTISPATNGAPEKEPRLAATSERQTTAASQPGSTQQADAQQATAQAAPTSERVAPADPKGARAAQAFHGTYSEMRGVSERNGSSQEVAVQEGTGSTQAAPAARVSVLTGYTAGQEGSGDQEQKGHPEQKAQSTQNAAATLQALDTRAQASVESRLTGEAKPAQLKELHENILSQVKDGVVTHDGKGNGQLSIRLNPGELGELKIQVRMDDNRVRVEVQADNKMVKDLLMSNLDSLKESLTSKNFSMEGFDVSTGGGFNSPLNEQQGDPQQQQRAWVRTARADAYGDQPEPTRVNYMTEEVNTLLDVRF